MGSDDLLRCEHCRGPLEFVEKDYQRGTATYDCLTCNVRYEYIRVREAGRIRGERWERKSAKRIKPPEEKKGA